MELPVLFAKVKAWGGIQLENDVLLRKTPFEFDENWSVQDFIEHVDAITLDGNGLGAKLNTFEEMFLQFVNDRKHDMAYTTISLEKDGHDVGHCVLLLFRKHGKKIVLEFFDGRGADLQYYTRHPNYYTKENMSEFLIQFRNHIVLLSRLQSKNLSNHLIYIFPMSVF